MSATFCRAREHERVFPFARIDSSHDTLRKDGNVSRTDIRILLLEHVLGHVYVEKGRVFFVSLCFSLSAQHIYQLYNYRSRPGSRDKKDARNQCSRVE